MRIFRLQEGPNEKINYLDALSSVIYFYKKQHGTRNSPARSCRELHLEHPESPSGKCKLAYIRLKVKSILV